MSECQQGAHFDEQNNSVSEDLHRMTHEILAFLIACDTKSLQRG